MSEHRKDWVVDDFHWYGKTDAEFIHRACNAHDALVDACDEAQSAFEMEDVDKWRGAALAKLKAALKAARP